MAVTTTTGTKSVSARAVIGPALMGLAGMILSLGGNPDLGAWLSVVGFVALGGTLHRFGRTGPDPR